MLLVSVTGIQFIGLSRFMVDLRDELCEDVQMDNQQQLDDVQSELGGSCVGCGYCRESSLDTHCPECGVKHLDDRAEIAAFVKCISSAQSWCVMGVLAWIAIGFIVWIVGQLMLILKRGFGMNMPTGTEVATTWILPLLAVVPIVVLVRWYKTAQKNICLASLKKGVFHPRLPKRIVLTTLVPVLIVFMVIGRYIIYSLGIRF